MTLRNAITRGYSWIIIAAASSVLYSYFFFSSGIKSTTECIALGILFGVFIRFVVIR